MKNTAKLVGARLRQAREEAGYLQKDVQKFMGYGSTSTISSHELGKRMPHIEELLEIADFYNVSIDWLYGRSPSKELNFVSSDEDVNMLKKIKNTSEKNKSIIDYVLDSDSLKQTEQK
jgi:transcriptional regulator with XRE-family HTH domain